MRRTIDGKISSAKITPETVVWCLKQLKLATKFRRHKERLAMILSYNAYQPIVIPSDLFTLLLTNFRRIEFHWDHGGKSSLPERRVFLSYPYVYYQLCYHLKRMDLTGPQHLIKSKKLLIKQHLAYGRLAKKAELNCDLTVFRTK